MDMLNSIHQEPSRSYGILNGEVTRVPIWIFGILGLLGILVSLWVLISLWFIAASAAA